MFGMQIELTIDPMAFAKRMILDCFTAAVPETWIRRAEAFHQAQPRTGDFIGRTTTRGEFFAAVDRCRRLADLCLQHAELLADGDPWAEYECELYALLAWSRQEA
jgi:hypothetical protein